MHAKRQFYTENFGIAPNAPHLNQHLNVFTLFLGGRGEEGMDASCAHVRAIAVAARLGEREGRRGRVTDRQTDTTPRKASQMSRLQQQKNARRSNALQARTALCSAVLAPSGTATMTSSTPWPVPGHQRLDTCRCPLGASQQQKNVSKVTRLHSCEVSLEDVDPILFFLVYLPSTLLLPLVVRRRCWTFLFESLAMEKDLAEDVCQLVDTLCIFRESRIWRAHHVSYESEH